MRAMALMAGGGGTAWAAAAATREVVDVVGTAGAGGWASWCGPLVAATRGGRHRLGLWGGHAVAVRGVGPAVCGPPAARRQGATADRPGRGPRGYWCPLAFFFARLLPLLHGHFCRGPDAVSLGRRVAPFAPTSSSPFPPSSAPCRCAPVSFPALVAVARAVVVGWLRRPGCRRRRRLAIAAARRLRGDLTTGRCCGHRLSIVHVARHQRPWAVPQWGWRPMIL